MDIAIDRQVVSERCSDCEVDFTVVRGSVYDAGQPFALYVIALHGHSPEGQLAHLALGILDLEDREAPPIAFAMDVVSRAEDVAFSLVDWAESPWGGERYLGTMLDRAAALESPLKSVVFHIADHVVEDLPEVQAYFA